MCLFETHFPDSVINYSFIFWIGRNKVYQKKIGFSMSDKKTTIFFNILTLDCELRQIGIHKKREQQYISAF